MTKENNLKKGVGVLGSMFMGIGGASPLLSIAATGAALIAVAGYLAPVSVFYCGLIMFGITLSFINLNKMLVDEGAAFAWVTKIFGHTLGFLAGWALLVASTVFMVSAMAPTAQGVLSLFNPLLAESTTAIALVGSLLLALVSIVVLRGSSLASRVETVVTVLNLLVMVAVILTSFTLHWSNALSIFHWSMFSPQSFTPAMFTSSALLAIFFYWGWDVTMNLNEETTDAKSGPAKGASFAMLALVLLFVLFIAAITLSLSQVEIAEAGSNIVFAITEKLFPGPLGILAVVAVFLSGIGAIETQILQFTRTVFSMSRAKAFSPHFAHLHAKWNTPWLATLMIWLLGTVLLLISSYAHNVSEIMTASVNAICFQVAFYYGLTGLACAWHYLRRTNGASDFLLKVLWPGMSALFLFGIGLYSMSTFDNLTIGIGVGGVLLGFIPMIFRKNLLRLKK